MRAIESVTVVLLALVCESTAMASSFTLDQALESALANSKSLQAKRLAVRTAESERAKARLWSPSNPEFEIEAVSDVLTGNSGEGTFTLGLSQEVELGGQRGKRTKIADIHILTAQLEAAAEEQALRREVKAAFYSLMLGQGRMALALYMDSLAAALRDSAVVRVQGGYLPRSELSFLDLDAAASRSAVQNSAAALTDIRIQLMTLLGLSDDLNPEALGALRLEKGALSEDSAIAMALAHRLDLQELNMRQTAASDALDLAKSERIPNLTIRAFYSRDRSVIGQEAFLGNSSGIQGIDDTDHLFGLSLRLPLPLIDRRGSEITRFESEQEVNALTEIGLETQIRNQVRASLRLLRSSQSTVELLESVSPTSDSLFQLIQSAYSQGRMVISDYLTQKDRLFDTRLRLFDAWSAYIIAQEEAARALGIDLNENPQGENK